MTGGKRSVIWIASYPKSGNTWVRFLACNLIFGPQDSAAAFNQLAPDVHELRELPRPLPPRMLLKTHFQFSEHMPLASETAGAVYIVRHPADVLLSNFHYSRRSGTTGSDERDALDHYVEQFLGNHGDPRWRQLGMGTWVENVRSWIGAPLPFPVLMLRYEDLLAHPLVEAARLREFLAPQCTAEDVARAVAASSFEGLRAIEEADIAAERVGIFYKPYLQPSIRAGLRFMRAGRADAGRSALTERQRRLTAEVFAASMQTCGYKSMLGEPA
jgi:hypothetical protein